MHARPYKVWQNITTKTSSPQGLTKTENLKIMAYSPRTAPQKLQIVVVQKCLLPPTDPYKICNQCFLKTMIPARKVLQNLQNVVCYMFFVSRALHELQIVISSFSPHAEP